MADKFKFLYFKTSGKFYTEATGHLSEETFNRYNANDDYAFWRGVCDDNGGTLPGLSTSVTNMTIVIDPAEETLHGHPLIFIWRT